MRPEIIDEVPVVFLTGMDEVPKSRAVGFIRKPADTGKFLKAIRAFIEMGFHAPFKH
jgi:FixJ family two-component response regulator